MASFDVIPALDVLEGRCVRLSEGRREHVTIEGGDPAAAAARFVGQGAPRLHLIDLDGAFSGRPSPRPRRAGRGRRSAGAGRRRPARRRSDPGCARRGRRTGDRRHGGARSRRADAARRPFRRAPGRRRRRQGRPGRRRRLGHRDRRDAAAARAGVRRGRSAAAARHATRRDGSLAGPDIDLLGEVLEAGVPVLAAGGIASLDDLRALRDLGCEGAVVGSALWSGRFGLAEALAYVA